MRYLLDANAVIALLNEADADASRRAAIGVWAGILL
jgi:hypothetical protein